MDSGILFPLTTSLQIPSNYFKLRSIPNRSLPPPFSSLLLLPTSRSARIRRRIKASTRPTSPWDDKPYELLPGGRRSYIDEQDVLGFIDPPKELIPIDPGSYNPAAYLWRKIGDIPEERRHRLLYMLKGSLISKIWELAGTRYQDDKLAKQSASTLLHMEGDSTEFEYWGGGTSKEETEDKCALIELYYIYPCKWMNILQPLCLKPSEMGEGLIFLCLKPSEMGEGPLPFSWMNGFRKVIFRGMDGCIYGRILVSEAIPASLRSFSGPLYFRVRQVSEVLSTEQPCDLAYEFGDGLLDIQDFPEGFPKPDKHPWPFNDHLVLYIRHVGPGVLVGQAWQEGRDMNQVPKKFCGEILMVKECNNYEC